MQMAEAKSCMVKKLEAGSATHSAIAPTLVLPCSKKRCKSALLDAAMVDKT